MCIVLIAACLAVGQPAAATAEDKKEGVGGFSNETIGRIIGGVGGALLGSQIGKGKGRLIAVGAGAIAGIFLGGEIGKRLGQSDQEGIEATGEHALESGQTATWRNPDTGVESTARVTETTYRPVPRSNEPDTTGLVWRVPPLQLIGRDYRATTTTNIRGGPSTEYGIMDQLKAGERIHVVGKVIDQDWYMIGRDGIGRGFVHVDLLRQVQERAGEIERPRSTAHLPGVRECSTLEQEVRLPDGTADTRQSRACRGGDGKWVLI
jgi:surface antigen